MQALRKSDARGRTQIDWLDSYHSFSFGEYYDAANMGFGPLRVINEDFVAAGAGFPTHGHKNMEILTWVLSGALEHKDSLGSGSVIRPGVAQLMSAGKGILHSEFNPSKQDPTHLLQIWIMPDVEGQSPGYQEKAFDEASLKNQLKLIVSKDGADGSLVMKQDGRVYVARLDAGKTVSLPVDPARKYWAQAAKGSADVGASRLEAGDGLAVAKESGAIEIKAATDAEIILFDLPS